MASLEYFAGAKTPKQPNVEAFAGAPVNPGANNSVNAFAGQQVDQQVEAWNDFPGQTTTTQSAAQVAAQQAAAAEAAKRTLINSLRGDVKGKRGDVERAYALLFGDVDTLGRSRAAEIEKDAGDNINKLTEQYTSSIPKIESSYAALGAGDSTDTRDAKISAKAGYDDSVQQVGKDKTDRLTKVGNYVAENKAKWGADKDSIMRLIDRVDQTEDEGDLRQARNDVENKVGTLGADRAALMTDEGARGELSRVTADGGRFDAVKNALDNVMKSSLAGGVKAAAVQAITNSADLTEEDKAKVKLQYGDVYNAPVE